MATLPFREIVLARLRKELGEPTRTVLETGTVYRWSVRCKGQADVSIYITLDSPELPDYAHLFISDPGRRGPNHEALVSFIFRAESKIPEVLRVIREKVDDCT
ncbi:MAG TPA: hypothetical protein VD997_05060 [Phycisphaerales bacterium]|nr:hypothetical protein [Phycisphaerales bacterium]